jgi:hypothetical protein
VAQHLDFGRHIVDLLTDLGADLGEYAAAAALPFGWSQFMADLDPRKVGGELGAAGLAAGRLLFAQRRCFELGLDADRFCDVERGLNLIEEFDLPGGDA